jgi:hypothetical protein
MSYTAKIFCSSSQLLDINDKGQGLGLSYVRIRENVISYNIDIKAWFVSVPALNITIKKLSRIKGGNLTCHATSRFRLASRSYID